MSSTDLLLGFDAREMWLKLSEDWPEERQRRFLLRRDIIKPLSTDDGVWQSVFDVDHALQRPPWTGPLGLWEDLQALENALSAASNRSKPYWVIALTLLSATSDSQEQAYWNVRTEGVSPSLRDPSWQLLGYDVSDRDLLSGLTNLSWGDGSQDEVQDLYDMYSRSLNEYHLFTSFESAAAFIPLAEQEARAHAPFFVFGLWLLKKEEGSAIPMETETPDLA